ncbi:hypothetical protein MICRO80W_940007 [Micrococcus luteus]|nr:hypothetical protein MICRO80W_940007 [Micrococcus luteus]
MVHRAGGPQVVRAAGGAAADHRDPAGDGAGLAEGRLRRRGRPPSPAGGLSAAVVALGGQWWPDLAEHGAAVSRCTDTGRRRGAPDPIRKVDP